jgi:hypothetical protein
LRGLRPRLEASIRLNHSFGFQLAKLRLDTVRGSNRRTLQNRTL